MDALDDLRAFLERQAAAEDRSSTATPIPEHRVRTAASSRRHGDRAPLDASPPADLERQAAAPPGGGAAPGHGQQVRTGVSSRRGRPGV